MKILVVHNKYQHAGGEDFLLQEETSLLEERGHTVARLFFDNTGIRNWRDKIKVGFEVIYNTHSARLLEEKICEFNPDVVHVHNFFPLASPSIFFVTSRLRIPVVVTLHNFRLVCPSGVLLYEGKIYEKSIRSW